MRGPVPAAAAGAAREGCVNICLLYYTYTRVKTPREDVCAGSPRRAGAARVGAERVEAEEAAASRPAGELQGSLVDDCRIARVADDNERPSWPHKLQDALEVFFHDSSRGGTRRGIDARSCLEDI